MIKITHNFDKFAEELQNLTDKQLQPIIKRAMIRALKAGRAKSKKLLGGRVSGPKDKTWTQYFNAETGMKIGGSETIGEYDGHISFSTKTRGLGSYITQSKLKAHRKRANKHLGIGIKGKSGNRGSYAKPLEFDLIKGKKTKLRRTFAGLGNSKSNKLQVFTRDKTGTGISRPSAPSLSNQMRSSKNKDILMRTQIHMKKRYNKEFETAITFKFKQALRRASKK